MRGGSSVLSRWLMRRYALAKCRKVSVNCE
jgi:hypothetical protein